MDFCSNCCVLKANSDILNEYIQVLQTKIDSLSFMVFNKPDSAVRQVLDETITLSSQECNNFADNFNLRTSDNKVPSAVSFVDVVYDPLVLIDNIIQN